MIELAAVLGTIGTVFGIWSINRQMNLEREFSKLERYCHKLCLRAGHDAEEAANKTLRLERELELLKQTNSLDTGVYVQKEDPQTKRQYMERIDDDDVQKAQFLAAENGDAHDLLDKAIHQMTAGLRK